MQVAWPLTSDGALVVVQLTDPLGFAVMVKVAVPVGVPEPGALADTVAVKTTCWPDTEGLTDEATAVVVASLLTVCVAEADLPEYVAVTVWEPTEDEVHEPVIHVPPVMDKIAVDVTLVEPLKLLTAVTVYETAWPVTTLCVEGLMVMWSTLAAPATVLPEPKP